MSSETHLEVIQGPSNCTAPLQKGTHSGTSTMRRRQQDSSLGSSFIAFLVQVRVLVAHRYKVNKAATSDIMCSAVTRKLN